MEKDDERPIPSDAAIRNADEIRLADYAPPLYRIERADLDVSLERRETRVRAKLSIRAESDDSPPPPLILNGEGLRPIRFALNGEPLRGDAMRLDETALTLRRPPKARRFELETECVVNPEDNAALSGLYVSGDVYCTQCEAEGFRRLTWFLDRPDAMSAFSVDIDVAQSEASAALSNGNLISESLREGRLRARWIDPHLKPSYLFALVAGPLDYIEDEHVTSSGRRVTLRAYAAPSETERCRWALECLKKAMRWDEEAFGREYDLDLFMLVAAADFNMGAMENKGLNIFNERCLLADPDVASDADYASIESIVAHEYLHNWTGNRVTCRDWFQLCLKEGLTVFRDQEFTSSVRSSAVKRVVDAARMQSVQFLEDAGPLAHPPRPSVYREVDNLYTSTVYEKGAELFRMMRSLVGDDAFRRAMDLFFDECDGRAVAVEDVVERVERASGRDLAAMIMPWFERSGTPHVAARGTWDSESRVYELRLRQFTPPGPWRPADAVFEIPLRVALLDDRGNALPLRLDRDDHAPLERLLMFREAEATYRFLGVSVDPIPSLNRGFSAPIRIVESPSDGERRLFLLARDSDPYSRWSAGRGYALDLLARRARSPHRVEDDSSRLDAFAEALRRAADEIDDPAFAALTLALPSASDVIVELGRDADPLAAWDAAMRLRVEIGRRLRDSLRRWVEIPASSVPYSPDARSAGRRALRHAALGLLALSEDDGARRAADYYRAAETMTERMAALELSAILPCSASEEALEHFRVERAVAHPLLLDRWLRCKASDPRPEEARRAVEALADDSAVNLRSPNRAYALFGGFAANVPAFHGGDGEGYVLLAEAAARLDRSNPQVAARLAGAFRVAPMLAAPYRRRLEDALKGVSARPDLSRGLRDVIDRLLAPQSSLP